MSIRYKDGQFHLSTNKTSYIFMVKSNKYLIHCYWGKKLNENVDLKYTAEAFIFSRASAFSTPVDDTSRVFLNDLKLEFQVQGSGDYRNPSFNAEYEDGSRISEFEYVGYEINKGKPKLKGLPATYAENYGECETLEVILMDKLTGIKAILSYSVFFDYDIITRSVRYINEGENSVQLLSVQSALVDFNGLDYKVLHLHGEWGRERNAEIIDVHHGAINLDSKRTSSSHMENPFIALMDKKTTEYSGNAYGFCLVYSGNFAANVEGSTDGTTRVTMGINAFNFKWKLNPEEDFYSPEVIMSFSPNGIDGMSQNYHRIIRERLCRGKYRDKIRPMIINHWEGTGAEFNNDKLIAIAKNGAEAGLEQFVIDDGWFGKRNDDTSSLGDWYVNKDKLPFGLEGLAKTINDMGMDFGIWVEPECINPDSDLYRQHPDWCMHCQGRSRTLNRNQLVLDLSRDDVLEYLIDTFSKVFSSSNINYVKWDYNRNISEYANPMQLHKYILGLYRLLDTLNEKFPDILFEGCSGGGGRFDAGMLYYMPQTWTSDNTNPISRIPIQFGTSIVYPIITMTGHIAGIETGKKEFNKFMEVCANVAMACNFGFELDMSKMSKEEIEQAKTYISEYKNIRKIIQFGRFHRLESPFDGNDASCEFVSKDNKNVVVFLYQRTKHFNDERRTIKLVDLIPEARYECEGKIYYGDELMNVGYNVTLSAYEYESSMKKFCIVD